MWFNFTKPFYWECCYKAALLIWYLQDCRRALFLPALKVCICSHPKNCIMFVGKKAGLLHAVLELTRKLWKFVPHLCCGYADNPNHPSCGWPVAVHVQRFVQDSIGNSSCCYWTDSPAAVLPWSNLTDLDNLQKGEFGYLLSVVCKLQVVLKTHLIEFEFMH